MVTQRHPVEQVARLVTRRTWKEWGRFAAVSTALVAFVLGSAGCAGGIFGSGSKSEPLVLVGMTSAPTVNLGDPIEIQTVLVSQYKKTLILPYLSAGSVAFWFTDESGRTFKREPVVSPFEDTKDTLPLEPGERWRRRFVLTQATETSGTFRIQLIYGSSMPTASLLPAGEVDSEPMTIRVRGKRNLHRDSAGVLLEGDAIRIARAWADLPDARAAATLVRNEAGYLDWWVRLAPNSSGAYRKACLVNAYLGEVRAEVNPKSIPPETPPPHITGPPPKAPAQPLRDLGNKK